MPGAIDVVIPVYNRFELTESCLRHLGEQTAAHRVIVVDDGSTDDTRERLAREWPDVTVVALASNQAYTAAVNRGVERGTGDYVVLLNNDVDLHPDCLERLVAPLRADAAIGSVASVMLRPGEQVIDSVGVSIDVTLAGFARHQGRARARASDAWPRLCGAEGTAGAYRRRAWEQVGGLDERITAYMEIVDVALRLGAAGWRTVAAHQATGVHHGSGTFLRRSPRQRELAGRSRGYMLRRWGVLRGRRGARALLTEAIAVAGDAVISRDLSALRGRVAGWRSARGLERHPWPPAGALALDISFSASLALRRGAYAASPRA